MATDLKAISRYTCIILGFCTLGLAIGLLIVYILRIEFKFQLLPVYLMPFFVGVLGLIVMSNEFNFPYVKENCQFLNHKVGVVVFYIYLSALMGHFGNSLSTFGGIYSLVAMIASIGYLALGILLGFVACLGEEKVNAKIDNLGEKISKE